MRCIYPEPPKQKNQPKSSPKGYHANVNKKPGTLNNDEVGRMMSKPNRYKDAGKRGRARMLNCSSYAKTAHPILDTVEGLLSIRVFISSSRVSLSWSMLPTLGTVRFSAYSPPFEGKEQDNPRHEKTNQSHRHSIEKHGIQVVMNHALYSVTALLARLACLLDLGSGSSRSTYACHENGAAGN